MKASDLCVEQLSDGEQGIFVGLATIDIVYGVDEFPEANTKIEARSQEVFVGGPATNAAIAFAHFGGQATLVTAVGRNVLAAVIREELESTSSACRSEPRV